MATRKYTDKEIEEMTSEQFARLQDGKDPYGKDEPKKPAQTQTPQPQGMRGYFAERKRVMKALEE